MEAENDHGRGRAFCFRGVNDCGHGVASLGDETYKLRSCLARRRPAECVIYIGPKYGFRLVCLVEAGDAGLEP